MIRFTALLLVITSLAWCQTERRAPGFSLPDSDLKQHDLQDYRGKIVVIEFMRTDCPSCAKVTSALSDVKAKFGAGIVVLSVVNQPDNQATVARYMAQHQVAGPMLFDCGQMTASYVQVTPDNPSVHFPQLFVIDAAGTIRSHMKPEGNPVEMESKSLIPLIEGLLSKNKR
jgi:peroxiredoxin